MRKKNHSIETNIEVKYMLRVDKDIETMIIKIFHILKTKIFNVCLFERERERLHMSRGGPEREERENSK